MPARMVKEDIYSVGVIDWDRTLFDALIPLPHGTSYNSYLVKGKDKVALIDTVDPSKTQLLLDNLAELGLPSIDYVISNHAEQDHSGSIPPLLEKFPQSQLITHKKGLDILQTLLKLPANRIRLIEDRQTIALGGKTLQFIFAPWVHWPETMFTYLVEDKILFSCDLFGSHLASSKMFATENENTLREMKRYYAEIMMPFSAKIFKHLETLASFEISLIAPSHGPVHDDPRQVIAAYQEWISPHPKNEVVLLYVSMHGSTEHIAHHLIESLSRKNISVKPFNLISVDLGELAMALVDSATVLIASPAVLMGPHPLAIYASYLLSILKPKTRWVGILGSFGWGNKMVDQISNMLRDLSVEFLPPVLIKGYPDEKAYVEIQRLADTIEQKHQLIFSTHPS